MALYHLNARYFSRAKGHQIIEIAARRSQSKLTWTFVDKVTNISVTKKFDRSRKKDVVFSEIFLPQNAAEWMQNREKLWSYVERIERRKDSRLAKEIQVALQKEFTLEQNVEMLRSFVIKCFTNVGMVADVNVHSNSNNPHAYILLTTRNIENKVFTKKSREWEHLSFLLGIRKTWADVINKHFKKYGFDLTVDHRSHKARGIDLVSTVHEGSKNKVNVNAKNVKHNAEIREENARRIVEKPEIIINLLTAKFVTTTRKNIEKEISDILSDSKSYTEQRYFNKVLKEVLIKLDNCKEKAK